MIEVIRAEKVLHGYRYHFSDGTSEVCDKVQTRKRGNYHNATPTKYHSLGSAQEEAVERRWEKLRYQGGRCYWVRGWLKVASRVFFSPVYNCLIPEFGTGNWSHPSVVHPDCIMTEEDVKRFLSRVVEINTPASVAAYAEKAHPYLLGLLAKMSLPEAVRQIVEGRLEVMNRKSYQSFAAT